MLLGNILLAVRRLARAPAFSLSVVICLTLGIGVSGGIFGIFDAVLLRPLPYAHPERLAFLWGKVPESGKPRLGASQDEFDDYRRSIKSLECVSGVFPSEMNFTGVEQPERLNVGLVTVNTLDCLGGKPVAGRDFLPEEGVSGGHQRVLLSHRFWRQRFSADPTIVGKDLRLNDELHTVVGVLPENFDLRLTGRSSDLWIPLVLNPGKEDRGRRGLRVIVRLADGIDFEQAGEELSLIGQQFHSEFPQHYPVDSGWGLWLAPLRSELMGENLPSILWMLQGAVLLVLLIACANVTNLFLARAAARQRETALRSALGAGRFELRANLLTEGLLLSLVSAGLGVILASWGLRLLVAWQGDRIHRLNEAGVDFRLLLGSLLVALLAGAVCSLLPLFRLSRVELREALSEEGRSQGSARGSGRLRQVLMIAEVAIALVVAVVTGLLFRSLEQLRGLEPGFAPEQVLTARLFISPAQYPERAQQAALARRLTTAAREISGVTRAGAISSLPLGELRIRIGTEIEGQPIPEGQAKPTVDWRPVEPDYFETMGIPLREGRTFTEADRLDSLPVTIVDERFAERYWPGQSPIDRRLKMPGASEDGWVWAVVVGVVGHVKTSGLDSEATEQAYTPFEQYPLPFLSLVVKSAMDFESLLPLLRQTVGSVAPDQPVDVRSMKEILEESWIDRRTVVFFMQALAAVSLVLAILGVYGVMAYTVALSHQEYGVRSALGARAIDIFGLVLKRGMGLVGIGLVIGLAGAWASSRLVATLLFETSSLDPVTYLLAPVTILVAALLANVASARQATKIDIIEVLRRE